MSSRCSENTEECAVPGGSNLFDIRHLSVCFATRLILGIHLKVFVVFAPFVAAAWDIPISKYPWALAVGETAGSLAGLTAPLLRSVLAWQILSVGQVGLTIAVAWLAFFPSLFTFTVERAVFGAARMLVSSAVFAAISQRVGAGARARAIGLVEASYFIADLALPFVGLALGNGYDPTAVQDVASDEAVRDKLRVILFGFSISYLLLAVACAWLFWAPSQRGDNYTQLAGSPSLGWRALFRPPQLACVLWPLATQIGMYGFTTVFGVWLNRSFGLGAAAVGLASLAVAFGEAIGFVLNFTLTDHFGPRTAVRWASYTLLVSFACLAAQGYFDIRVLTLALMPVVCIFASSEFAFVASMSWVAETSDSGNVSQLVMSVACRGASGIGRCIGTWAALPLFDTAGIWGSAGVASLCCVFSVCLITSVR
jgi:MFS family permease